jgi:hypothetical protein
VIVHRLIQARAGIKVLSLALFSRGPDPTTRSPPGDDARAARYK